MKSKEFKKIHKWHRCKRCKKLKWVSRETGYWHDLLCQECEDVVFENDETSEDWE